MKEYKFDEDAISKREAIVEKFNKQWEETNEECGVVRWNSNWIMDSERMNYVYDNFPSPRIKDFLANL